MTKEQQRIVLLSELQVLTAMSSVIMIQSPGVFTELPPIESAASIWWKIDNVSRPVGAQVFTRASLQAGTMALRRLSNFLRIRVTPDGKLEGLRKKPARPGTDLQWQHVVGALPVTIDDVWALISEETSIIIEGNQVVELPTLYAFVLQSANKSIAHLTNESELSSYYVGGMVVLAVFLTAMIQERILIPGWDDSFETLVLQTAQEVLPAAHYIAYRDKVFICRELVRAHYGSQLARRS